MAIIVETGLIITNANSYADLAYIDSYCMLRHYDSWMALVPDAKEAAIHRAMNYLETLAWYGCQTDPDTQELEWPRQYVYDKNENLIDEYTIPKNVMKALAEAAYRESTTAGILLPDLERGGDIKRMKADVLEIEYNRGAITSTVFSILDGYLYGLVDDGTKAIRG
jgi:hypothetical protein